MRRLVVLVWAVVVIVLGLAGPGYAIGSNASVGVGSSGVSRSSTSHPGAFTGTIHLRARDYLGNGAFYAPDPITLGPPNPASNPYLYVNARPLTDADPSGLRPIGGTDDVACMNCRSTGDGWNIGNENIAVGRDNTRRYTTLGGSGLPSAWGNIYSGDKYVGGGRHHTETYVPEVESAGDKIAMAVILGGAYSVPVAGQILTAIDIAEMSQDGFTQEECIEIGIGAVPGGKAVRGVSRATKTADDWPILSGIVRDAGKGKGNFGVGSGTASQATRAGESWVGDGYRIASDGKTLVSHDGLRTFRPPAWKPDLGRYQANFSYWNGERVGRPFGNGHFDVTDIP